MSEFEKFKQFGLAGLTKVNIPKISSAMCVWEQQVNSVIKVEGSHHNRVLVLT